MSKSFSLSVDLQNTTGDRSLVSRAIEIGGHALMHARSSHCPVQSVENSQNKKNGGYQMGYGCVDLDTEGVLPKLHVNMHTILLFCELSFHGLSRVCVVKQRLIGIVVVYCAGPDHTDQRDVKGLHL